MSIKYDRRVANGMSVPRLLFADSSTIVASTVANIRSKQVCTHPRHVAHVIAHVVCNRTWTGSSSGYRLQLTYEGLRPHRPVYIPPHTGKGQ